MSSFKSHAALFWVLLVIFVSVGIFTYLVINDEEATKSVMELSQFQDEKELIDSVAEKLPNKTLQSKFYWMGVEPGKNEHLILVGELIKHFKNQNPFARIIVDKELSLNSEVLKKFGATDIVSIKENLFPLGEKLAEFEKSGTGYILVTASIYTNSLLKNNPYNLLKEKFNIKPTTFSFAYLPTTVEEEKNMVFGCRTDDQTGTSDWGCVVISKARFARKKIALAELKTWMALMDLSSENNYIVILKKNEK